MEEESNEDTNWNWCTWNNPQKIGTQTGGLKIKEHGGDIPNSKDNKKKWRIGRIVDFAVPADHRINVVQP